MDYWRQLNLAPSFIKFANKADGLSASMPSLLHHHSQIVELWVTALDAGDNEALKALLEYVPRSGRNLLILNYPQPSPETGARPPGNVDTPL